MRSEQEIRNEINRLWAMEKEAVEDMEELMGAGSDYFDIYMQKANALQGQRITLEWVLNEGNNTKE